MDGNRKYYAAWKSKFNYWMYNYKQDEDEQLLRLRKALPKNSFLVPAICPVQKVKIRGQNGNFTEALTMLDSSSNTSFISKNVVKKLGIRGPQTHLTMNLAGGQKKSEVSEFLDITVV